MCLEPNRLQTGGAVPPIINPFSRRYGVKEPDLSASNALLSALSSSDAELVRPHLKLVELKAKTVLVEAGALLSAVYFPLTAAISLVTPLSTGEVIEAAMVGRDGVFGAASSLDGRMAMCRAIVQLSGQAMVCQPEKLRDAALQSHRLLSLVVRHEQLLFAQAQQSTACMAVHEAEARMCRWLLRARDLAGSDTLRLTQEFLAQLLGVNRTTVTMVALTLQQAGLISYKRGAIQLLNIDGLRDGACECYATTTEQYKALVGPPRS